jgi:hypothetical protein
MRTGGSSERRAEWFTRLYPRAWRERYGEEFAQLLIDDLRERPRAPRRDLDVVGHALWARLAYRGVAGRVLGAERRSQIALHALVGLGLLFLVLGLGVWSQMTVGWQWAAPTDPVAKTAMWLMSVALLGFAILSVPVIVRVAAATTLGLMRGEAQRLWLPALMTLFAAGSLYLGCRHFGAGWPGTGGHPWSGRGLVPGWLARLGWAGTLWLSSYWAHPAALRSFPVAELVWMALSPAIWVALVTAGLRLFSRIGQGPRRQWWTLTVGAVAVALMCVFLAGAGMWVLTSEPGPRNLFAVGMIDLVVVVVLAGTLIGATHMLHRAYARPVARAVA